MNSYYQKKIILVSRCAWTLYNYRAGMIRSLKQADYSVLGGGSGGDGFESKISDLGVPFTHLPIEKKGVNPLADLKLIYRLWHWYRKEKPDIVHHFTIKPVIYGSLAARLAGVPKIVNTVTGLGYVFTGDNVSLSRIFVRQMFRAGIKSANFTFFQNTDDRQYLIGGSSLRLRTDVLPGSGVDCHHFKPENEPSVKVNGAATFLLVARMLKEKGIYEFVEAARDVQRRSPQIRFQLLGDRDVRNPNVIPREDLNRWQEAGIVKWFGAVEDVRPFLAAADVVVLPSYYREGIPRSLLEAAAMGKPIITTDAVGCREAVDHRKTGLLVPAKDVSALVQAMEWMLEHREQRLKMGMAGRRKVEKQFDEKVVIDRIMREYKK
ncbi:MAG: glycosyltransferase family 4 protein [bacterium]|nr:glycosyltransferase family 4 protein [bacterium]